MKDLTLQEQTDVNGGYIINPTILQGLSILIGQILIYGGPGEDMTIPPAR